MTPRIANFIKTAKDVNAQIKDDDVPGLAADIAYHFTMALFPFLLFLVALTSFIEPVLGVDDLEQKIVDEVAKVAPDDVTSTVETLVGNVLEDQSAGALTIGLVLAIWGASSAMETVMKAVNRAYDIEEERTFLHKRGLAIALTILTAVFFITSIVLIIGGDWLGDFVSDSLNLGRAGEAGWNVVRIVVVLVLVALAMAFVYWKAPVKDQHWVWVSPGSAFFVIAWILATLAFSFYIANFGNYNETYGTIGAAIIMLFWFYITGFCIVLGAEINAILERRFSPETAQQGAEPEPGKERPAGAAGEGGEGASGLQASPQR
jgi:membrane protein